jgi:hypothetical protein
MAHYWLDAAGVCDIGGQHRLGQPSPDQAPKPAITETSEPLESGPVKVGQAVASENVDISTESVNPITEIPLAHWGLALLVLVGACSLGTIWTRNRVKESDSTPNSYPDTSVFNKEER